MRFIDISTFTPNAQWLDDAKTATNTARGKQEGKERADYINGQSDLWTRLKPKFEELSFRKCWYCETRENRSDRAVDHYRPKNKVRDTKPLFRGYWWLAFCHKNYRLCCNWCNSRRCDRATGVTGGKGDYFLLMDEKKRVRIEGASFKHEGPLFLDPCKPQDVALLWYADDGRVIPKFDEKQKPEAFKRADKSIEYYNLNERDIKEARQVLYHKIKELVEQGDYHFEDSFNGVPDADHSLGQVIKSLGELIDKKAEYSAFAKAVIEGFKKADRLWMDAIGMV
ncbi:MAG: hypothetical protein HYR56_34085 [Acidobacteria bacterium]|nr:hypothetical protein [Acidobacteriota bacterium]MBI3422139.1 hypothetical protein [Acidobacteriota bacterium]